MHNCGEGVNIAELNILAGEEPSMLRGFPTGAQGDRSLKVNAWNFRRFCYGRFDVIAGETVLDGRLVTLSGRNWQREKSRVPGT